MTDIINNVPHSFQLATLIIFICALVHTLLANYFITWSEKLKARYPKRSHEMPISFYTEILHFLGEVEVIFGLWVIPLVIVIVWFFDWPTVTTYLENRPFTEAMFIVVVMSITATKPIFQLVERVFNFLSKKMGSTIFSWWIIILTLGPILGSFITEAGAMTLCALLLGKHFYSYGPSKKLAYATLGLLFVNISVGGLLTSFSAPPVLVIRKVWDWDTWFMFSHFGIKTVVGIVLTNTFYYFVLRKEFLPLEKVRKLSSLIESHNYGVKKVPLWITLIHILFLVAIVYNGHYPQVFIGIFLLFLGFHQATEPHQFPVQLKRPMLVGLFLAGLFIHGGLQGWWINNILQNPETKPLMFISTILTAFNDNAAVIYLASLLPNLTYDLKYSVISGAVIGGGLTIIANAPNLAGVVLLKKFFKWKISPLYLLFGALAPTIIFYLIFYLLDHEYLKF